MKVIMSKQNFQRCSSAQCHRVLENTFNWTVRKREGQISVKEILELYNGLIHSLKTSSFEYSNTSDTTFNLLNEIIIIEHFQLYFQLNLILILLNLNHNPPTPTIFVLFLHFGLPLPRQLLTHKHIPLFLRLFNLPFYLSLGTNRPCTSFKQFSFEGNSYFCFKLFYCC